MVLTDPCQLVLSDLGRNNYDSISICCTCELVFDSVQFGTVCCMLVDSGRARQLLYEDYNRMYKNRSSPSE